MGETTAYSVDSSTTKATERSSEKTASLRRVSRPCSELFLAATATHTGGSAAAASEDGRIRRPPVDDERVALLAEVGRWLSRPGGRVLLIGEPGVGRSTILAQLDRQAKEAGARVIRARPLSAAEPFSGLVDLLSNIDDVELGSLPAAQRRVLESLRSNGVRPVGMADRMALRLAVAGAVRALQRSGSVVISVDDWTLLDAESVDVVGYLVTRSREGESPSLVATQVVDARLSGQQPVVDRAIFPPGTVHVVPPLSVRGLADVLAEWKGEFLPPDQLASIYRAVGGNPSWAMELLDQPLRQLQSPDSGPALPNSVAEVALTRVRRLPPLVLRVLAACAAMKGAPAGTVIELSGTDCAAVVAATEEGVIGWHDGQLEVAHPLLGAAALKVVGLRARLELHARAAQAARGLRERACQLDQATLPGPDSVVAAALGEASEQAWAAGAIAPALAHACRALARTAPESAEHDRRAVMVAELASATGWFDRAAAALAGLDLLELDLDLLDRALPSFIVAGATEGGDQNLQKSLTGLAAQAGEDSVRWAMVDVRRMWDGDPAADRVTRACRALKLLAGADVPRSQHRCLALLLVARMDAGQGLDQSVLTRMRALETRLLGIPLADTADAAEGVYAYQVGDLAASRDQLERLVDRAEDRGEAAVAGEFRAHLALVELMSGRQASAAGLLQRPGDQILKAAAPSPIVVHAAAALALVRGDHGALEASLAQAGTSKYPLCERIVRLVMAAAWAAVREDWANALPPLLEARTLTAEHGIDEPGRRLWLDTMLGSSLVALDRLAEAEQIATDLEALASAGRRPAVRGHALRVRGLASAASGDLATANEQLHRAAQLIARGQVPGDHARCLLDLGRVLRRRRARKECRRVLLEASAIANRIGDLPLLTILDRELASPGRSGKSDVLTPAERRVAVAVAEGLSNREIAVACFVTVRTVETQLTSVYRKLGVRSRSQLAARLPAEPQGQNRLGAGKDSSA